MTLEDTLSVAVLVANEVIPFDRHRAYWRGPSGEEEVWHFRTGKFREPLRHAKLLEMRRLAEQVGRTAAPAEVEFEGKKACVVWLDLPDGRELLIALFREEGLFNEHYRKKLALVARLTRSAVDRDEVRELLVRLRMMFLHRRKVTQTLRSDRVLDEYLQKALLLIHPRRYDPLDPQFSEDCEPEVIRGTAKLVNPHGTLMRIVAYRSSREGEWPPPLCGTLYPIHPEGHDPRSIAAHVYRSKDPKCTNNYPAERLADPVRLFPDSRCHISVPIVSGWPEGLETPPLAEPLAAPSLPECLGVLSVETTAEDAYDEDVTAAFALLAGHAAWPLGRALIREEAGRKTRELLRVQSTLRSLHGSGNTERVFEALEDGLRGLEYRRGLLCAVRQNPDRIVGERYWGDDAMRRLCARTRISPARRANHKHRQVQAVRRRKDQAVADLRAEAPHHPREVKAELVSFGIFPLKDAHGRVAYTLLVEPEHTAPLGPLDRRIVRYLAQWAMEALERVRHAELERLWTERVLRSWDDEESLYREFARFVCESGVVTRCRVYREQPGGDPVGAFQAGDFPVDDFVGWPLAIRREWDDNSNRETSWPIRVVRRAARRRSGRGPLRVTGVPVKVVEAFFEEARLRKEDIDECVEVPVMAAPDSGRVVARLFLDHKGRRSTRFTMPELRLLGALVRTLSLGVKAVESHRLEAYLARAGLDAAVQHHCLLGYMRKLSGLQDLIDLWLSDPARLRALPLDALGPADGLTDEQLLRTVVRDRLQPVLGSVTTLHQLYKKDIRLPTIRDALTFVEDLLKYSLGSFPGLFSYHGWEARCVSDSHALCLILIKLLTNVIDKINLPSPASAVERRNLLKVMVGAGWDGRLKRRGPREGDGRATVCFSVINYGPGLPDHVVRSFREPPRILEGADGHGTGLAFARLLASRAGGELTIFRQANPTWFNLALPLVEECP